MIRTLISAGQEHDAHGFRLRGREVSRLEGLSDAVFGFAITLLVVSLEVPRTAAELFQAMRGFVAFGACFALLYMVWHEHYRFFRRYGLEDTVTETLNAVLLFVVLFFVYPLKFVFGWTVGRLMGDPATVSLGDGSTVPVFRAGDGATMMLVFSGGYLAVFTIFALLHLHALRQRDRLALNEMELFDTVAAVRSSALNAGVGAASVAAVLAGGGRMMLLAIGVYWAIGPIMWMNGWLTARARRRLAERVAIPQPAA